MLRHTLWGVVALGCAPFDREAALVECGFEDAFTSSRTQEGLTLDGESDLTGLVMVVDEPTEGASTLTSWTCVPGFGGGRRMLLSTFSLDADGSSDGVSAHRFIDSLTEEDRLLEPVGSVVATLSDVSLPNEETPGGSFRSRVELAGAGGESAFDVALDVSWVGL
jgi:hypothetical protein